MKNAWLVLLSTAVALLTVTASAASKVGSRGCPPCPLCP